MSEPVFDLQSLQGQTVRGLIDHWAGEKPDDVYLVDPNSSTETSFLQLQKRCRALSKYLHDAGLTTGETVGYAFHNGVDAAVAILAIMYGGYTATAINLVSGKQTISHVLNHSAARLVLCQEKTLPLLTEAAPEKDKNEFLLLSALNLADDAAEPDDAINAQDDALLMYTSGTTGVPKGVVHTHASLLAGGGNAVLAHQLTERDRGLCVLPLYHINGLCVTLLGSLVSGSSLVVPDRFSVSAFWGTIRRNQCSWFSVVPTQISYLLQEAENNGHDPSGLEVLRFGRSASAPLSPDVQTAFEERFNVPIIETMGLTETAAQILSNPIDGTRKIGSPGIAFGNEVIIADDHQNEVSHGREGEVLVRGHNVMKLYRNNDEATTASLTPNKWLRTGDLGRMDDEGYVFITGRLKELIIKGGENIAPREIDEALYSHPDVVEAAAFPRECKQYGQKVEAGVMIRVGSDLNVEQLYKICEDRLGKFKSPEVIHVLPELPKGPSGKIQRLKIADMTA
ncbi:MAG: AMP-binding protein [Hyphomicrobiales bacterium]